MSWVSSRAPWIRGPIRSPELSLALENLFAHRLAIARPLFTVNQTGAIARALTPAPQTIG